MHNPWEHTPKEVVKYMIDFFDASTTYATSQLSRFFKVQTSDHLIRHKKKKIENIIINLKNPKNAQSFSEIIDDLRFLFANGEKQEAFNSTAIHYLRLLNEPLHEEEKSELIKLYDDFLIKNFRFAGKYIILAAKIDGSENAEPVELLKLLSLLHCLRTIVDKDIDNENITILNNFCIVQNKDISVAIKFYNEFIPRLTELEIEKIAEEGNFILFDLAYGESNNTNTSNNNNC